MAIVDALLPEFDHEFAHTRRSLERIPDSKFDWKPHPKSRALGSLGAHLAGLPTLVVSAIDKDSLDVAAESATPKPAPPKSTRELLELFDKNVKTARATLARAQDDHMMKPWSLFAGKKTIATLPRVGVIRAFILNHNIHHRAQLGVYLRLNDIAVPSIYGPSADEAVI
jgi:uncharacterized damage-inducible protein DinB